MKPFNKKALDKVANATVKLVKKRGQGVLIRGNLILTAAHCIEYDCEGKMALGEYFIETIETSGGTFKVAPLAVEPVSDIAVLGALDDQTFPEEFEAFEEFCQKTEPVEISTDELEVFKEFKVRVRSHREPKWINAQCQACREGSHRLALESTLQIEGGTSGGPIINEAGLLVGIVSNASNQTTSVSSTGLTPRPHLALPMWVWRRIVSGEGA